VKTTIYTYALFGPLCAVEDLGRRRPDRPGNEHQMSITNNS
jgi:hypothetical protein